MDQTLLPEVAEVPANAWMFRSVNGTMCLHETMTYSFDRLIFDANDFHVHHDRNRAHRP